MGIIYMIENQINNKKYIGQTTKPLKERIKQHLQRCNKNVNLHLYNSIRKYGFENFKVTVLKDNIPVEELDRWECYFIGKYNTFNEGYNNTIGGGGVKGYHHSPQVCKKISKTISEHKDMYTLERAMKISKALKGVPKSVEHRKHLSEYRLKNRERLCGQNNGFYGKQHTDKSKKQMSESSIKYDVIQMDENGKELNKFNSVQEASEYVINLKLTKAKLSSVMYRIYRSL